MTLLALGAPTAVFGDPALSAGFALPNAAASSGAAVAANGGLTFVWQPGTLLYFSGATSTTVNLIFVGTGGAANATTGTLLAGVAYLFGPIPSCFVKGSTGIVTVNINGNGSGAYAAVYLSPSATSVSHNPLDMSGYANADY